MITTKYRPPDETILALLRNPDTPPGVLAVVLEGVGHLDYEPLLEGLRDPDRGPFSLQALRWWYIMHGVKGIPVD